MIKNLSLKLDSKVKAKLYEKNDILDAYSKFNDYSEAFNVLPYNSLTVSIQLSRTKT